jgi:transposase
MNRNSALVGDAFDQCVKRLLPKLVVEVVKRTDTAEGFKILPRRWVIERTCGRLMRHRRLARDHEKPKLAPRRRSLSP